MPNETPAVRDGSKESPLDSDGLCLLSLDGGGVRGLSTLYILKELMDGLNHERKKANPNSLRMKPCDIFDLIGGTSTGGLLAIMLGRLEMDVDQCISAYTELMEKVFSKSSGGLRVGLKGNIKARCDSETLHEAVKTVVISCGMDPDDRLCDGRPPGCRVFVCATEKSSQETIHLRSYSLSREFAEATPTIGEAALATSAATSFFEPVSISGRRFVDGGLSANNPAEEVEREASDIWCADTAELMSLVKCFVSVGTGDPGMKGVNDNIKGITKTLLEMATETEKTADRIAARWRKYHEDGRYFRFNVQQGLQGVDMAEFREREKIAGATCRYLKQTELQSRMRKCVRNLQGKQNKTRLDFDATMNKHCELISQLRLRPRNHKPCRYIPFECNDGFVGRNAELAEIESKLFIEGGCSKMAVYGLGGIGKTQIVLELAYRTMEKRPDCSIFWLPAISVDAMKKAYLDIGRQLQLPGLDEKDADIVALLQQHLSQDSSGQWLLIIDNADDVDMWFASGADTARSTPLIKCLPRSSRGSILFTTRTLKAAIKYAPTNTVKIHQMNEDDAKQFLHSEILNKTILQFEEAQAALLHHLAFLPLAIRQATAYINENDTSLSEYLELLEGTEEEILEVLSEDFEDEGRYSETKNPVAVTWLISFEQIRKRDPLAAEYLSFMSCIEPKAIPKTLLPSHLLSKIKVQRALGTLLAYSFVAKRPADELLDLHSLVRLATRNWLKQRGSLGSHMIKAMRHLANVFPSCDECNRAIWRAYLPHAMCILAAKCFSSNDSYQPQLLLSVGRCLLEDGRYNEAERVLQESTDMYSKRLGEEHPSTLISMSALAYIYSRQKKLELAQEIQEQLIDKSSKIFGESHQEALRCKNNLALTYQSQGRLEDAEELLEQVLDKRRKRFGEDHPATLESMFRLASCYWHQRRLKSAQELFERVLDKRRRVLGENHPDTLTSMDNLARTYCRQRHFKDAEELYKQILDKRRKVLGEDHPDTLISMGNLASTYRNQERPKDAEELFEQVLDKRRKALGEDHPNTLTNMRILARSYRNQGRLNDAEELYKHVFDKCRKLLDEDHPLTLTNMQDLAVIYGCRGRDKEALDLMCKCAQASQRTLGADHRDTRRRFRMIDTWQHPGIKRHLLFGRYKVKG
ncbi:FabD/lysophospholipase-like protein [Xylona heveae TC161]|uniref:FabD/lysophospholipase-like protein n=1 Tax=Xylona heveae (strain CBS 132557 / TC161) TaxID=1328760 RepID=A0A165K3Z5_XYLHT|nr:FabD/lysophospholipase-like protein [Xylona heveae TC161]KZF26958.1 FabD/lysophospholipase-like protein [Xylona heveae TC161]